MFSGLGTVFGSIKARSLRGHNLDNSLEEEFNKVLLSGRKMQVSISSYSHTMHSLQPGDDAPTVTTNRAVSRLQTAFLSFFAQAPEDKTASEMTMFAYPLGRVSGASHPGSTTNLEVVPDSDNITYQWISIAFIISVSNSSI